MSWNMSGDGASTLATLPPSKTPHKCESSNGTSALTRQHFRVGRHPDRFLGTWWPASRTGGTALQRPSSAPRRSAAARCLRLSVGTTPRRLRFLPGYRRSGQAIMYSAKVATYRTPWISSLPAPRLRCRRRHDVATPQLLRAAERGVALAAGVARPSQPMKVFHERQTALNLPGGSAQRLRRTRFGF